MLVCTCTLYIHENTLFVYSTLAKLVIKKENPDPIHHTRTVQTQKEQDTWVHCMFLRDCSLTVSYDETRGGVSGEHAQPGIVGGVHV